LLNQRLQTAKAVATELLPAEREVDSAIVRSARLTIAVVEGRERCKLPLTAGQEGLSLVTQATARLVEAREFLAHAHAAFRTTQAEIGLQAVSFGDATPCPPSAELAPSHLTVVA
jgi:hypothetical protein